MQLDLLLLTFQQPVAARKRPSADEESDAGDSPKHDGDELLHCSSTRYS
jgi:hypothetical protein